MLIVYRGFFLSKIAKTHTLDAGPRQTTRVKHIMLCMGSKFPGLTASKPSLDKHIPTKVGLGYPKGPLQQTTRSHEF